MEGLTIEELIYEGLDPDEFLIPDISLCLEIVDRINISKFEC